MSSVVRQKVAYDRSADLVPNLVAEDLFGLVLELESQKAVRLQYCVSVVVACADTRRGCERGPDRDALSRHIARVVARQVRATDVVTVFSSSEIGILLIDAAAESLSRILDRGLGVLAPYFVEQSLTWSAGGACFPLTVCTGRALLPRASELMGRARDAGGDQLFVSP